MKNKSLLSMKSLEKSFDGEQIKAKYQDVFKNLF